MRRKLTMVADFIWKGGSLTGSTTIQTIMAWSSGSRHSLSSLAGKNKATAPIKLSPANFPTFTGEISEQEHYKTKAEVQIRQTAFKFLLTYDAHNQEEKEHDEELFNVFKNLFHGEKAYNIITLLLKDASEIDLPPSGHRVLTNFLTWCNSGGHKSTLIKNLKNDLKNLKLDGDDINGF
eukprot:12230792-Ditylum_brightwellii.AAC.1